jgi:hypothetical protein
MEQVSTKSIAEAVLVHLATAIMGVGVIAAFHGGVPGTLITLIVGAGVAIFGLAVLVHRFLPGICRGCGGLSVWRLRTNARYAQCVACGRRYKRVGVPFGGWQLTDNPADEGVFRARRRPQRSLSLKSLNPAIDRSTCGRLLGAKRNGNPLDFLRRKPPEPLAPTPRLIKYEDHTVGRLLVARRLREGRVSLQESASGPSRDPWCEL